MSKNRDQNLDDKTSGRNSEENLSANFNENADENLNANVGVNLDDSASVASKSTLNLDENGEESTVENLNRILDESAERNSGESGAEQGYENLDQNASKVGESAEKICVGAPKCKAQNLFKKALEISLQSAASALVCAGRAGLWLLDAASELKDEAQKAQLSKINEEQAKFDGAQIISRAIIKEIVANRLKTDASGIEFGQIYLVKRHASGLRGDEYFYEAKAKSNGFSYDFKIAARGGEILKLKIKS
ncbi:hypothetical protein [uncultured Campylobacter sp.]|uniref:hypothetical protein n=1 Tax=uncultured Campylobacter sp. TaxID=218934 RepID=UPI00260F275D|nr:hypothetical protein [uncultured Campylobacter sp.]